ncbi:DUF3795 domain-containing protein [candidate division KSB1 bacterium]|nr:DUF3795 domain-containing protein [candidate division KSB1 bacterium]
MIRLSSYCGILCEECPIYLATRERSQNKKIEMRAEIAEIILKEYNIRLRVEEITDCDGCKTKSERLFVLCKNCSIRSCAQLKDLDNCAECHDYPCDNLSQLFLKEPNAQERLEMNRLKAE